MSTQSIVMRLGTPGRSRSASEVATDVGVRERGDDRRERPRASRREGTGSARASDGTTCACLYRARRGVRRRGCFLGCQVFLKNWRVCDVRPSEKNFAARTCSFPRLDTFSRRRVDIPRCADRRCGGRRFSRRRSPRELLRPRSLRPPGPRTKLAWGHGRRATRATSAFWTMRRNHLPPHPQARTVRCTARGAWGATWCFLVWTAP